MRYLDRRFSILGWKVGCHDGTGVCFLNHRIEVPALRNQKGLQYRHFNDTKAQPPTQMSATVQNNIASHSAAPPFIMPTLTLHHVAMRRCTWFPRIHVFWGVFLSLVLCLPREGLKAPPVNATKGNNLITIFLVDAIPK